MPDNQPSREHHSVTEELRDGVWRSLLVTVSAATTWMFRSVATKAGIDAISVLQGGNVDSSPPTIGSIIKEQKGYFPPSLRSVFKKRTLPRKSSDVSVKTAAQPNSSGTHGMIAVTKQILGNSLYHIVCYTALCQIFASGKKPEELSAAEKFWLTNMVVVAATFGAVPGTIACAYSNARRPMPASINHINFAHSMLMMRRIPGLNLSIGALYSAFLLEYVREKGYNALFINAGTFTNTVLRKWDIEPDKSHPAIKMIVEAAVVVACGYATVFPDLLAKSIYASGLYPPSASAITDVMKAQQQASKSSTSTRKNITTAPQTRASRHLITHFRSLLKQQGKNPLMQGLSLIHDSGRYRAAGLVAANLFYQGLQTIFQQKLYNNNNATEVVSQHKCRK